jgi:hypothetical protein
MTICEKFIIVWLDVRLETNNHIFGTIEQLHVISNYVKIFNDSNTCIDYNTNLKNENVLFIISKLAHRCILTFAQGIPKMSALYILCLSETANYER